MANLTCGLSTVGAVAVRAKRLNCDGTEVGELDAQAAVAGYVSCKFTEVTLTPVVIEGDTIQQNNADGKLCINVGARRSDHRLHHRDRAVRHRRGVPGDPWGR